MLHEPASGSLRDIDRIATKTLKRAAGRKLEVMKRQSLQQVVSAT